MKQSKIIFMCEQCNKPLAEEKLEEVDIKEFKIFIREGSFIATSEENSRHIAGYYCSLACLTDKILENTKEDMNGG